MPDVATPTAPTAAPMVSAPATEMSPIDQFFGVTPDAPTATPTPDAPATPAETKPEPAAAAAPAESSRPDAPAAKPDATPAERPAEKMAPKELRTAYEGLKRDHKALREELRLAKEASNRPPADIKNDPEVKAIQERLAAAEKRRSELEEEIKFKAYERSEDYIEHYDKPYKAACAAAVAQATELKIVNSETGETRQATPDDFWKIATIGNTEDAINAAETLFGTPAKANLVMALRDAVRRAWTAAEAAKAEYRVKGAEREKAQREQTEKQAAELSTRWSNLNKEAAEKYPHYFKPIDGDEKGNELLANGFKEADLVFGGANVPPEELVKVHSAAYNKIAGFNRLAARASILEKENAELKEKLKGFQESEPKPGDGERGPAKAEKTFEDRLFEVSVPTPAAY